MSKSLLSSQVWVLVGDGKKALVLRNDGDDVFPNLKTIRVFNDAANPATSQLGSDRPGRTTTEAGGRRSAVEQTDWHEIGEHRFAQHVASALDRCERDGELTALIVVAPPHTLAELRRSFAPQLRAKVIYEMDKDLTKHPIHEIERLLAKG